MFLVPVTRQTQDFARSFERLFDDSLFDRFLTPRRAEAPTVRSPALDVVETERAYTVRLDMPGVAKEDVKIAIDGRRVQVEAQTTRQAEQKDGERVLYTERSATSLARSFSLPAEVSESDSAAKLTDGVLTLTLAKKIAPGAIALKVE